MNMFFYLKLAAGGIRKNGRIYLPYLLTSALMVMIHYIVGSLSVCDALVNMPQRETVTEMLSLGGWVLAIFSLIFLLYTNSFLVRRRKREFGLYNILGMGKRNIARIILWESLMAAAISLAVGLFCGVLLSKLFELALIDIIRGDVTYTLSLSPSALVTTVLVFSVIFFLLLLNSLRQLRVSTAMALLRSENVGEKPPRGNWLLGILGAALLGCAYYIAVSIGDPLSALLLFFAAVVMVIIGTYLVMISCSVLFCRLLQKNKRYYYKPNHFVSVSSMVYRMKRNGAGLASICILATMILIMISSTASLYLGEESTIRSRYPREIDLDFRFENASVMSDENVAALMEEVASIAGEHGVSPSNDYNFRSASVAGFAKNGVVDVNAEGYSGSGISVYGNIVHFFFVPLSDYNRVMGTSETLSDGEAIACGFRCSIDSDTVSFIGGSSFRIVRTSDDFIECGMAAMIVSPSVFLVVPDLEYAVRGLDEMTYNGGNPMLQYVWRYNFDTCLDVKSQPELCSELAERLRASLTGGKYGVTSCSVESREANRQDFYMLFGGLLYIGLILSAVFLMAAVLIIYYKQISEGYEDQARFEIMQKVGMTGREIKRSINSQLLTVFYLPLIFAAVHLAFAFPMIEKLLLLFNLDDTALFASSTAISLFVFALIYMAVYRMTSNAYYKIVRTGTGT